MFYVNIIIYDKYHGRNYTKASLRSFQSQLNYLNQQTLNSYIINTIEKDKKNNNK